MKNPEILFDRRIVEKNLREERITPQEYEKFKRSLADVSELCQYIPIEQIAPASYLKAVLGIEPAPMSAKKE